MTRDEALARLAALCARAEHCTYDLRERLRRWGFTPSAQDSIVATLQEEGFVDDARYARLAAQEKLRFNGWGRQKIYLSLAQKRIDSTLIRAALDAIDDSEYVAVLVPLLRTKSATLRDGDPFARHARLVRYALARGFTMDIIRRCLAADGTITPAADPSL